VYRRKRGCVSTLVNLKPRATTVERNEPRGLPCRCLAIAVLLSDHLLLQSRLRCTAVLHYNYNCTASIRNTERRLIDHIIIAYIIVYRTCPRGLL
jgi:hypothetical protein